MFSINHLLSQRGCPNNCKVCTINGNKFVKCESYYHYDEARLERQRRWADFALQLTVNGVFPLPYPDSYADSDTDSYEINKGSTGTDSDDNYYADSYTEYYEK